MLAPWLVPIATLLSAKSGTDPHPLCSALTTTQHTAIIMSKTTSSAAPTCQGYLAPTSDAMHRDGLFEDTPAYHVLRDNGVLTTKYRRDTVEDIFTGTDVKANSDAGDSPRAGASSFVSTSSCDTAGEASTTRRGRRNSELLRQATITGVAKSSDSAGVSDCRADVVRV